jgi:uncharacterized membrane protein
MFEDLSNGKGTKITATFSYGKSEKDLANTYAKLLKIVNVREMKADMRRFKKIMETGALPEISG